MYDHSQIIQLITKTTLTKMPRKINQNNKETLFEFLFQNHYEKIFFSFFS